MTYVPTTASQPVPVGSISKQALHLSVVGVAVTLALLTLYAVFLDQGMLLSPVLGKVASTADYLHELAHDGRHLLGAPCH